MIPTGPLHPELLAIGLAIGLVASGWALVSHRSTDAPGTTVARAVHASVAGALAALAATGLAPRPVLLALGITLVVGARPRWADGWVGPVAGAVAVVFVAVELEGRARPLLLLLPALGVLLAADRHGRAGRRPAVATTVAGLACAGLWASAPDTEVVVMTGALLAGALTAGVLAAWRLSVASPSPSGAAQLPFPEDRRTPPVPWPAVWILLTWSAAYGYRGRPGGLGGALVALVAVAAWNVGGRWRPDGRAPSAARTVAALAGTLAVVVVAARTVGLDRALDRRPTVVAGLAVAGVVLGLAGTLRRRPRPATGPTG